MIRLCLAASAAAIIIVAAAFVLAPGGAIAATCAGHWATASYYGAESGSRTASGLRFDGTQLIVAHKTLPFGTRVRITYRGRSIVLPVEDRGPYIRGREFDLSRAAAARIGMIPAGVGKVCAERLN